MDNYRYTYVCICIIHSEKPRSLDVVNCSPCFSCERREAPVSMKSRHRNVSIRRLKELQKKVPAPESEYVFTMDRWHGDPVLPKDQQ